MLMQPTTPGQRFAFVSDACPEATFTVVALEGTEALSRPFRFSLTLKSSNEAIDFRKMLQQPVHLTIFPSDGQGYCPYHGILAEFEQLDQRAGQVFYRVVMVPRLWRLSQYRISEVYLQEQSIVETLRGLLNSCRLGTNDVEYRLTGDYRPRSYVCQYQETYFDFMSRWLEREGMYYFFTHDQGWDKLVIVDDVSMLPSPVQSLCYRYGDALDPIGALDNVWSLSCRQQPLPQRVILQDFNYRKANLPLKISYPVADDGVGDVMLYGENFRDEAEGLRYARLRAEELVAASQQFVARSTAVGVRAGFFVELSGHYREDFNQRYLVTGIEHHGRQAGLLLGDAADAAPGQTEYQLQWTAIPASTPWRPRRETPRPRMAGSMEATVDAEGSGQVAELDAYGQYKVQLPFDLTDKPENHASAPIRMASPYAGSDHGMHFPLHKNAEVLLSFIDGDPDQPVIVGALPNSENPNVVTAQNPQDNQITTAGGNRIVMRDTSANQALWLHSPTGNTTIALGAVQSDSSAGTGAESSTGGSTESSTESSGPAIWQGTEGSSVAFTVGQAIDLTVGGREIVNLGYECTHAAGMTTETKLGASTEFSWDAKLSWAKGPALEIKDQECSELVESKSTSAQKELILSAGLTVASAETIETAKKYCEAAVLASCALSLAGVSAGATELELTNPTPEKTSPESYGYLAAMSGVGAIMATAEYLLLKNFISKYTLLASQQTLYQSNIVLKDSGITLETGALPPVITGTLSVKPAIITATVGIAPAAGQITLESTALKATVGPDAALGLDAMAFKAAIGPDAKLGLSATTLNANIGPAASVALTADSYTATVGMSTVAMKPAAVDLTDGLGNFHIEDGDVYMESVAGNYLQVTKARIVISDIAGENMITIGPVTKVAGLLVQIG